MIQKLISASILMAVCVCIHAGGLALLIAHWKKKQKRLATLHTSPAGVTLLLVKVAVWLIFLHLLQIMVWAVYFNASGAFAELSTAFYFSSVTYTTTGFGDILLPDDRRLMAGIQSLTGILMCGVSTGFFFAVFSQTLGKNVTQD